MYDTIPKTQEHTGMCSLNSFILINFVCGCVSECMSGAPRMTPRLSHSTIRVPGKTQVINLGIEHLYPFSYLAAQVAFLHRNKESYFRKKYAATRTCTETTTSPQQDLLVPASQGVSVEKAGAVRQTRETSTLGGALTISNRLSQSTPMEANTN